MSALCGSCKYGTHKLGFDVDETHCESWGEKTLRPSCTVSSLRSQMEGSILSSVKALLRTCLSTGTDWGAEVNSSTVHKCLCLHWCSPDCSAEHQLIYSTSLSTLKTHSSLTVPYHPAHCSWYQSYEKNPASDLQFPDAGEVVRGADETPGFVGPKAEGLGGGFVAAAAPYRERRAALSLLSGASHSHSTKLKMLQFLFAF